MTTFEDVLLVLIDNPIDVFEETCRLLVKIAENVLKNPGNLKVRTLQKDNQTIKNKILAVRGGTECLKLMGFQENRQSFDLPSGASLNNVEAIRNDIVRVREKPEAAATVRPPVVKSGAVPKKVDPPKATTPSVSALPKESFKRVTLPPYTPIFTNPFLRDMEEKFHSVLMYEDSHLQERAEGVIPVAELERRAQKRLRSLHETIKKEKLPDPEINLQDMLIIELLAWFKIEFFEWVDNPKCQNCGGDTTFSHISEENSLQIYTKRVEMHVCSECQAMTPFPRYNDVNILLETRKGRCGEWANTFTLLCRAMGWDARIVYDETDHVWTEVYSYSQKRWLHCDPCENVVDSPLIYEYGWKKQLSYVMAYSVDEVQDVTWRYSNQHKTVLGRRKKCGEQELVNALLELRKIRQKGLSKSRKKYLAKRLLTELVDLMVEKKISDKDSEGRQSGSLNWRMSRGETEAGKQSIAHTWTFEEEDLATNEVTVLYSAGRDVYQLKNKQNDVLIEIMEWQNGSFSSNQLFRKEESDWKMAYICRKENTPKGTISWKFEVAEKSKVFDEVKLVIDQYVQGSGEISIELCNGEVCTILKPGETARTINDFSGSRVLTITAELKGGSGRVGWQHAQLFRQSLDSEEFPFKVTFTFKAAKP